MNRKLKIFLGIIVLAVLAAGVFWSFGKRPKGQETQTNNPAPQNLADQNTTGLPLTLAAGFSIETFAKNIVGARVIVRDLQGNFWVSQTSQGTITELEAKNGKVIGQNVVFRGLKNPHGLAIDGNDLYIAEETRISKVALYSDDTLHKIADLPSSGGGHFTRTLGFGPDGRLYVSIGSSCNVCVEADPRRASVYSLNKDGSDFKQFASGLRNTVFFVWNRDGSMWGTDNGRDNLGDNIPPDEINVLKEGANYGWPNCYGNDIHDTSFDKNVYIRNPCMEPFEIPSTVDLQAHSAPLGIAFAPKSWPADYQNNLIVAFHGSWNRTQPTGYKLVRVKLDDKNNYLGTEDFLTGFLKGSTVLGRPVDVLGEPDGSIYVTDDKAGAVYRIYRTNPS